MYHLSCLKWSPQATIIDEGDSCVRPEQLSDSSLLIIFIRLLI